MKEVAKKLLDELEAQAEDGYNEIGTCKSVQLLAAVTASFNSKTRRRTLLPDQRTPRLAGLMMTWRTVRGADLLRFFRLDDPVYQLILL